MRKQNAYLWFPIRGIEVVVCIHSIRKIRTEWQQCQKTIKIIEIDRNLEVPFKNYGNTEKLSKLATHDIKNLVIYNYETERVNE